MTARFQNFDPSTPNPHLPHNSTEIEGTPPVDAANEEMALANADLLISQLMQEETRRVVRPVRPTVRQFAAA